MDFGFRRPCIYTKKALATYVPRLSMQLLNSYSLLFDFDFEEPEPEIDSLISVSAFTFCIL